MPISVNYFSWETLLTRSVNYFLETAFCIGISSFSVVSIRPRLKKNCFVEAPTPQKEFNTNSTYQIAYGIEPKGLVDSIRRARGGALGASAPGPGARAPDAATNPFGSIP